MRIEYTISDTAFGVQIVIEETVFYLCHADPTLCIYERDFLLLPEEEKQIYTRHQLKEYGDSTEWVKEVQDAATLQTVKCGYLVVVWLVGEPKNALVVWIDISDVDTLNRLKMRLKGLQEEPLTLELVSKLDVPRYRYIIGDKQQAATLTVLPSEKEGWYITVYEDLFKDLPEGRIEMLTEQQMLDSYAKLPGFVLPKW